MQKTIMAESINYNTKQLCVLEHILCVNLYLKTMLQALYTVVILHPSARD